MRPRNLRIRIEALADGRCEYCHAPQHACGYHFHLEHIVPLVQGGADELSNRALVYASCRDVLPSLCAITPRIERYKLPCNLPTARLKIINCPHKCNI